ncbi:putative quorum-sensing-regulated virulence factor [Brevifollis gellanilyticus]|uniref:DUF3820 family protein n=1 Tax=Brevifollis gellanilyticus TaxID=748831 RepID=A0A512MDE3_9BACT|nr:DUF3820 family protein [Brevifollis gellanilyticus]GEP44755.1 hypothetical protein BGE01nite_40460 [Brevifollis gellanilyticus]
MDDLARQMQHDLEEIGRTHMPFGKFGPQFCPPNGVPIYDLPAEYLAWFANKAGFPKGRFGKLLQMVYQMKVDGSDVVFDVFRRRRGGRTPLREERQRSFDLSGNRQTPPEGA